MSVSHAVSGSLHFLLLIFPTRITHNGQAWSASKGPSWKLWQPTPCRLLHSRLCRRKPGQLAIWQRSAHVVCCGAAYLASPARMTSVMALREGAATAWYSCGRCWARTPRPYTAHCRKSASGLEQAARRIGSACCVYFCDPVPQTNDEQANEANRMVPVPTYSMRTWAG